MKKDSKDSKKTDQTNKKFQRFKIIKSVLYIFPYFLITLGFLLIASPFVSNFLAQKNVQPEIDAPEEDSGTILGEGLFVLSANAQEEMNNVPDETLIDTGHTKIGYEKSKQKQDEISTSGNWSATDYSKDDIKGKLYVVQPGDTLWEISEAYFGNGHLWKNILALNSSDIGFLPNGSQALIIPGQVLVLS